MRNNNVVNCVRYGHSLEEIESDIRQIKENYETINNNCMVEIDLEPDPKETNFDGSEKEFNVVIKTIFVE